MSHKWTLANPTLDSVVTSWQKRLPRFRKNQQHDAHDAWTSIIDLIFTSAREENFRQRRNPTKPNRAIVEAQVEDLQLSTSATFTRTLICQCGTAKENHVSRAREFVLPPPSSPDCTLQSLVNQSLTPKQSLVTCYCATCQKDTPHASSEQYTLSPAQQILTLFRNTALSEFDAPVPLRDIAQFSSPCDPLRSFELAAGMIHYASTPKTRHFCSFRRASTDSWLYTNDSTAFLINSAQLEQTVPYVLFYISTATTN